MMQMFEIIWLYSQCTYLCCWLLSCRSYLCSGQLLLTQWWLQTSFHSVAVCSVFFDQDFSVIISCEKSLRNNWQSNNVLRPVSSDTPVSWALNCRNAVKSDWFLVVSLVQISQVLVWLMIVLSAVSGRPWSQKQEKLGNDAVYVC